MTSDSLFSEAGWFFFVFWSLVIGAVSFAAFRGDPASEKAPADSLPTKNPAATIPAIDSGVR